MLEEMDGEDKAVGSFHLPNRVTSEDLCLRQEMMLCCCLLDPFKFPSRNGVDILQVIPGGFVWMLREDVVHWRWLLGLLGLA